MRHTGPLALLAALGFLLAAVWLLSWQAFVTAIIFGIVGAIIVGGNGDTSV